MDLSAPAADAGSAVASSPDPVGVCAERGAPAGPPSRLDRLSEWLRPLLVVGLLTFSAGVVFGNLLPARAELAATQRRLDEQREDNARLKRKIADLAVQADRLAKDPWLTERILRDELRMSGEGEIIVR